MATTTDSKAIHLGLSVSGGGEAFGPFFAVLTLTRKKVEWLLTRADLFRNALALDDRLYQMTWFDHSPDFCEKGMGGYIDWDAEDEDPNEVDPDVDEDCGRIARIFNNRTYPNVNFVEFPADQVPEQGNVRLDYCKLIAANSFNPLRPDRVDFHWEACIKHTSEEIETCNIEEEQLRELLARL
jgi:hypothetical protein